MKNADRNFIDKEKYIVLTGNILSDNALMDQIGFYKYDIVFANIVADVIIASAENAAKQLKPGGIFITSGIINTRKNDVLSALNKFDIVDILEKDDWVAIAFETSHN